MAFKEGEAVGDNTFFNITKIKEVLGAVDSQTPGNSEADRFFLPTPTGQNLDMIFYDGDRRIQIAGIAAGPVDAVEFSKDQVTFMIPHANGSESLTFRRVLNLEMPYVEVSCTVSMGNTSNRNN